jgi:adenosylhomocysteine nucleosidase
MAFHKRFGPAFQWALLCLAVLALATRAFAAPRGQAITAVLGAQTREISMLRDEMTDRTERGILGLPFWEGTLAGRRVVIARMASGKVNAAMVATLVIEHYEPAEVIVTGVAGGLNPELGPGDMIIANRTVQHDIVRLHPKGVVEYRGARNPLRGNRNPVFLETPAPLVEIARQAAGRTAFSPIPWRQSATTHTVQVITGTVATGDAFVANDEKRAELREKLKADAVEMEGAAVGQICYQLETPCLVIRCVSDFANDSAISDFDSFADVAAANSAHLVREIVRTLAANQKRAEEGKGP